jgi:hypothetical protein
MDPIDAGGAPCTPFVSPAICSQTPMGPVMTPTLDTFRKVLAARWVLCGSPSVFGNGGRDIGLEIVNDGTWYKLYPGPVGSTVRGAGFDEEGKWEVISTGSPPEQPFQLNLNIFGSGTVITHPVFAATPPAMRLNNNGVFVGNYVLDPTVPVSTTRCR